MFLQYDNSLFLLSFLEIHVPRAYFSFAAKVQTPHVRIAFGFSLMCKKN